MATLRSGEVGCSQARAVERHHGRGVGAAEDWDPHAHRSLLCPRVAPTHGHGERGSRRPESHRKYGLRSGLATWRGSGKVPPLAHPVPGAGLTLLSSEPTGTPKGTVGATHRRSRPNKPSLGFCRIRDAVHPARTGSGAGPRTRPLSEGAEACRGFPPGWSQTINRSGFLLG